MVGKQLSEEQNIQILSQILQHKDILLGKFSQTITKSLKEQRWQECYDNCIAMGIDRGQLKSWKYLRDEYWANKQRLTKAKVDRARPSGAEGGAECMMSAVDNAVLQILGRESPTVKGLGVASTWAPTAVETDGVNDELFEETSVETRLGVDESRPSTSAMNSSADSNYPAAATSRPTTPSAPTSLKKIIKRRQQPAVDEELAEKKKLKLDLEIENLRLKNRLINLKIYKAEQELGVVCAEEVIMDN